MFNIQSPEDWEAFQPEYEERKELMEQMAKERTITLQIDVKLEVDDELEITEAIDSFVNEMNYKIDSHTEGVKILDTEVVDY